MQKYFSERYGYKKPKPIDLEEMPISFRNRIWNFFQMSIEESDTVVRRRYGIRMNREEIIGIIWDKFFKEDLDKLKKYWVDDYI